jgi:hypothetical protein
VGYEQLDLSLLQPVLYFVFPGAKVKDGLFQNVLAHVILLLFLPPVAGLCILFFAQT